MFEFGYLRGFLIIASPQTDESLIEYFVIDPRRALFKTPNLVSLQCLMRSCSTFGELLDKCARTFEAIRFDEIVVSPIRLFESPETLPFYSTKCFQIKLRENANCFEATVFAFDDEYVDSLFAFVSELGTLCGSESAVAELLALAVPLFRAEQNSAEIDEPPSQAQIDAYKAQMRLLVEKIERDKNEFKSGAAPIPREIVGEGEPIGEGGAARILTLSNGSQYVGATLGGRPHGNGKEFLADGTSYVGEFRDGLWHGRGYLVDADNGLCHAEFFDDRVVGI